MRRMVHGIEVAREIAATEPFAAWRAREVLPGTRRHRRGGAARVRRARAPGPTTTRSAAARWASGPTRWCDPDLRVHGLTGCGWPTRRSCRRIVCVNTNAATIMIGEKAADLIRIARLTGTSPVSRRRL